MSDSDIPRDCPHCTSIKTERFYGSDSINLGGSGGGLKPSKVPDSFKDVLKHIKKNAIGGDKMQSSVI